MSDTTQRTPEERVSDLELAARMQIGMNEAIVVAIQEMYAAMQELMPEAADGETVQPLTGLELVRQMVEQQRIGAVKVSSDIELIRRMNKKAHGGAVE